ncbi:hypothetical protein LINGRAHAP2_LOCUS30432 [Linum grandiflorum]
MTLQGGFEVRDRISVLRHLHLGLLDQYKRSEEKKHGN